MLCRVYLLENLKILKELDVFVVLSQSILRLIDLRLSAKHLSRLASSSSIRVECV